MNNNEFLQKLKTRLSNCEKSKEKNFKNNCSLNGCIATVEGMKVDSFLNGKIEILKYCIAILEENEKN